MSRVYTAPTRLFYFGCWADTGHFIWTPNGTWPRDGELPWSDVELDTGLCPGPRDKRGHVDAAHQTQGSALLHHRAGFSAIAFWDRSGDCRGGSNSAFIGDAISSSCTLLAAARVAFPTVFARLDAAGVRITLDAQELLDAAAALNPGRAAPKKANRVSHGPSTLAADVCEICACIQCDCVEGDSP